MHVASPLCQLQVLSSLYLRPSPPIIQAGVGTVDAAGMSPWPLDMSL